MNELAVVAVTFWAGVNVGLLIALLVGKAYERAPTAEEGKDG